MADLDFLKGDRGRDLRRTGFFSGQRVFWDLQEHDIPATAGAYVLLARGTRFRYPIGTNAVYYIGQSTNLRERLRTHVKRAQNPGTREFRQSNFERPRYEYAWSFGTHYCYVTTCGSLRPKDAAKELEKILMGRFLMKHRSFPVANGAVSWKRITSTSDNIARLSRMIDG